MKHSDLFKIFLLRTVGNFLLLSALTGVALTFAPAIQAEISFRRDQFFGQTYIVAGDTVPKAEKRSGFSLLLDEPPPLAINPIDPSYDIIIPKIGANARIIPNVDPGNESAYFAALKQGVAHAAGTVYPGLPGNSYLFAHSVGNFWEVNRWNAVFYLLKEIEPGDEIDIYWNGERYLYRAYEKRVVEANETGYLSAQANYPMLTLQTCWPPGTTLKRLLVFARLQKK